MMRNTLYIYPIRTFLIQIALQYLLSVIKDQYPSISADQVIDSLYETTIGLCRNAADDYGLKRLTFN